MTPRIGTVGRYRHIAFDTLGSTNDEAMARLRSGDGDGLFVTAARQTGGRGRQGRVWTSPDGNLYASLGLALAVPPRVAPQLGFVAGVALAAALRARLDGDARLRIKWPNDMIFDGAKLAGILLESTKLADGRLGFVLGFGVNCRSHPADLPYPATDLATAGDRDPTAAALLTALAAEIEVRLAIWGGGLRFDEIRRSWLDVAIDHGTRLAVTLPDATLAGTFAGLDETGRLLLDTPQGRHVIDAGDVFLPELATANKQSAITR